MAALMSPEEARFVDEMGLVLEADGRPRIAGLILGWLLICEPAHQSFSNLVDALGVSKGSVSSMTRLLIESGLIERHPVRGDRQIHYRIAPDAWVRVLQRQVRVMEQLSAAAERGMALVAANAGDHERLREMRDLNRIAARQMPELIQSFERARRAPADAREEPDARAA